MTAPLLRPGNGGIALLPTDRWKSRSDVTLIEHYMARWHGSSTLWRGDDSSFCAIAMESPRRRSSDLGGASDSFYEGDGPTEMSPGGRRPSPAASSLGVTSHLPTSARPFRSQAPCTVFTGWCSLGSRSCPWFSPPHTGFGSGSASGSMLTASSPPDSELSVGPYSYHYSFHY